ncbi:MAG: hypothetical protein ACLTKE_07475 [Coprococcus sp.]
MCRLITTSVIEQFLSNAALSSGSRKESRTRDSLIKSAIFVLIYLLWTGM